MQNEPKRSGLLSVFVDGMKRTSAVFGTASQKTSICEIDTKFTSTMNRLQLVWRSITFRSPCVVLKVTDYEGRHSSKE